MPRYNPTEADADESMYDDGADSGATAPADEQEDEGGETALLPKSLCPGMKPGDKLTLKIESVQDDSYQVSYPPKKEVTEEEPAEKSAPMMDKGDMGGESMYG